MNDLIEFNGEKITVCLTSNCNINCQHCYIDYRGSWSVEELKGLFPVLKQKCKISLNGAEPLTNLSYLQLYPLVGYHRIFTNGKIIADNPTVMKAMKKYGISQVSISYHYGTDMSPVPIGIVERAITLLVNAGFDVEMMTTITKQNYKAIDKICEIAYALKVKSLYLLNLIQKGKGVVLDKNKLTVDEIKSFVEQLEASRLNYSKNKLYIARAGLFDSKYYRTKKTFECFACKHAVLTPDKKIYPCIFCIDPAYQIGILENNKLLISSSAINNLPKESGCLACNAYNFGFN